ncbi:MAG TPA: tetratricopeptide repeat protein, partial [Candidatus Sumerlaeota bacterium]|nr:tetratricopeptide repeat protein [Candidatus Sumerlaeota bacterium]
ANDLIDKAQYGEAVTLIESARQEHPRNVVELNGLMARVHRQQGNDAVRDKKYDIAAKSFAAATDADPQDTNNWISRGRALREYARTLSGSKNTTKRREALADALQAFEKAIDLSPAYPAAYLGVAQVQEARANKTKAIEAYQQIIKIAPDSNEARLAKDAVAQLQKK